MGKIVEQQVSTASGRIFLAVSSSKKASDSAMLARVDDGTHGNGRLCTRNLASASIATHVMRPFIVAYKGTRAGHCSLQKDGSHLTWAR